MLNFALLSRGEGNNIYLSLALIPFVWGDVLPATCSPPHLIVFSTLLCILSYFSSLPPLLPSSHLSSHSHTISALASLVSYCPAHVTLPLSSVACHSPSFQRVLPIVVCSTRNCPPDSVSSPPARCPALTSGGLCAALPSSLGLSSPLPGKQPGPLLQ